MMTSRGARDLWFGAATIALAAGALLLGVLASPGEAPDELDTAGPTPRSVLDDTPDETAPRVHAARHAIAFAAAVETAPPTEPAPTAQARPRERAEPPPSATLYVRIVDAGDGGLGGWTVAILSGEDEIRRAVTDAAGLAIFDAVPPAETLGVRAVDYGGLPAMSASVSLGRGAERYLELRAGARPVPPAARSRTLDVVVRNRDGHPYSATVEDMSGRRARSISEGLYRFEALAADPVRLRLNVRGRWFSATADTSDGLFEFVLPPMGVADVRWSAPLAHGRRYRLVFQPDDGGGEPIIQRTRRKKSSTRAWLPAGRYHVRLESGPATAELLGRPGWRAEAPGVAVDIVEGATTTVWLPL